MRRAHGRRRPGRGETPTTGPTPAGVGMRAFGCGRALMAVVVLLTGCGADGPSRDWAGTVDTLANGAVLVHNAETGVWDAAPENRWRVRERFRVGAVEGGGPGVFGDVEAVRGDALGRVYVLDRLAKEVRVFDGAGRHVRSIGGPGGGPGEFQNPVGLAWGPEGRLWVADPGNARFAVYDTTGTYAASYPREQPGYGPGWGGRFDRDGRILDPGCVLMGGGVCEPAVIRFRPDSAWDAAGRPIARDTAFEPRFVRERFRTDVGGRIMVFGTVPFSPRSHQALAPDGDFWFGVSDSYRLYRRTRGGDTLRIIEREYEPVPVTAEERDSAIRTFDPVVERGHRLDFSRIPNVKPAFTGIVVAEDGSLWVARPSHPDDRPGESGGPATTFDVFDVQGRFLGSVTAPVGLTPRPWIRGGRLIGVQRDEFGVQYVVGVELVG